MASLQENLRERWEGLASLQERWEELASLQERWEELASLRERWEELASLRESLAGQPMQLARHSAERASWRTAPPRR